MNTTTQLRYWLVACRLHTLPLSLSSVGVGTVLAYKNGYFSWLILVWVGLVALGLQVLANLANDLGDSLHGVDHAGRQGPRRMVQAGHMSKSSLLRGIWFVGIGTFTCGMGLLGQAFGLFSGYFWGFLLLGLAAIWAALRYAYGKRPYGHAGWGDLAVWLFFGVLGVKGTYLLYAQTWDLTLLLPGAGLGAAAVAVLHLNNLRDIDSDVSAGKYSVAARLGKKGSLHYHRVLLFVAMLCWSLYAYFCLSGSWNGLFLLTYPGFLGLAYGLQAGTSAEVLNRRLQQLVLLILGWAFTFALGIWLST